MFSNVQQENNIDNMAKFYSLDAITVSQGFHVCKETTWSNANVRDEVKDVLKEFQMFRSSHRGCSIKNSQGGTCVGVSFLIKLQASGLQLYSETDSDTGVFLSVLRKFYEHLFQRTTANGCF